MLSGVVYLINDVRDREADRLHPVKSRRPIAVGRAVAPAALAAAAVLGGRRTRPRRSGCRPRIRRSSRRPTSCCSSLYSTSLKHLVILDVLTIAVGFVLRAMAGAVVVDVRFSHWLLLLMLLGRAVPGAEQAARGAELLAGDATGHRRILAEYSPYLLDQMISVVTASTLLAYAFYTIDPETVAEVRHGPAAVHGAVSAVRDLSVPVSGAPARRGRQPVGDAA